MRLWGTPVPLQWLCQEGLALGGLEDLSAVQDLEKAHMAIRCMYALRAHLST